MKYFKEFMGQRLILFLTFVFVASGIAAAVTLGSWASVIAMATGAVLIIVIEYTVHRYILHEFPRIAPFAYKGHVAHHQLPNDVKYLFGPVSIDFWAYLIIGLAAYFITGMNAHLAFAVAFGGSGFQLYYQWKHYISHRPITPITPWGRWMKKRHLLHHHLDEKAWYGVSNPMLDMVLGTNTSASSRPNRPSRADRNHTHHQ